MELFDIILFFICLAGLAVIVQYARALRIEATPWWSFILVLALSIGVPYIILVAAFTTFGRGALFIGPVSMLVAYFLITGLSIVHYSLRIKNKGSFKKSDAVLDDSEF